MENKYYHLADQYYLGVYEFGYELLEKKTTGEGQSRGRKSKELGKEYYVPICYPKTIQYAIKRIRDLGIKEEFPDLLKMIQKMDDMMFQIEQNMIKWNKDGWPYWERIIPDQEEINEFYKSIATPAKKPTVKKKGVKK